MSIQHAIKQFHDNIQLGGGNALAQSDPEKFNLYNGLLNIARSLETIEAELQELKRKVGKISENR